MNLVQVSLLGTTLVILLFCWIGTTDVVNGNYMLRGATTVDSKTGYRQARLWIPGVEDHFNYNGAAAAAKHLIVVAGHSVTTAHSHLHDADHDESDWYLLDFQKHQGLPEAIVGHIRTGIAEARSDPLALLVFSGGETRSSIGPESEGASYYRVSDAMGLWGVSSDGSIQNNASSVRARTTTEEFATDSFENLLFSICRFHEITDSYPTKITVVSYTFKGHRFQELHAPALQFPTENFHFIGYDPPSRTGFDLDVATAGEIENSLKPYESDPYGCNTKSLQEKRIQRNPFSRTPPYELSCPEMKDILHYCGPNIIDKSRVPW